MFTYEQGTGRMTRDGVYVAVGYSGAPMHVNKPEDEQLHALGCIPRGLYTFDAPVNDVGHTGEYSMPLTPDLANAMYGRSGFRCHGDNPERNESASEGCIVLPYLGRYFIWMSGDHRLQVVSKVLLG